MARIRKPATKKQRPKRPLRPGQPALISKLDSALTARLCAQIRKGLTYETCCKICRISPRAFYEWMAHGQSDSDAGLASAYATFYAAIEEANAAGESVLHAAAIVSNPLQVLVRRFPSHYPSERLQMELSGKDGQPISLQGGVQVVIESSASTAGNVRTKLTPFADERPDSVWFGISGLCTDADGHIFDVNGKLVGVLRELPAVRAPALEQALPMVPQSATQSVQDNVELQERIAQLEGEIARAKAINGVPGRLSQLVR